VCRLFLNEHHVADTTSLGETVKRSRGLMYVLPTLGRGNGISTNDWESGNNARSNCTVELLSYHNFAMSVRDVARIDTLVYEDDPNHVATESRTYDATQDMAYQYLGASAPA
jgi:hypothetical protein